jgi:hypothetical protein
MSGPGYYACLEVGCARNPSGEILVALARALVLDAAEREHPNDLCTHAGSVPDRPDQPQRV